MGYIQLVQRERKRLVDTDHGFHGRAARQRAAVHHKKRGPHQREPENGRDLQRGQLYDRRFGHGADRGGREERAAHLLGDRRDEPRRNLDGIADHRQGQERSAVADLGHREIFPISGSGERLASKQSGFHHLRDAVDGKDPDRRVLQIQRREQPDKRDLQEIQRQVHDQYGHENAVRIFDGFRNFERQVYIKKK